MDFQGFDNHVLAYGIIIGTCAMALALFTKRCIDGVLNRRLAERTVGVFIAFDPSQAQVVKQFLGVYSNVAYFDQFPSGVACSFYLNEHEESRAVEFFADMYGGLRIIASSATVSIARIGPNNLKSIELKHWPSDFRHGNSGTHVRSVPWVTLRRELVPEVLAYSATKYAESQLSYDQFEPKRTPVHVGSDSQALPLAQLPNGPTEYEEVPIEDAYADIISANILKDIRLL